jgi:tol-pal system protein YbgF
MKQLSIFLISILCTLNIFADNVSSKKIEDIIDESDREEVRVSNHDASLLNRVEVLEHKIIHLEKIVNKITTHQNQASADGGTLVQSQQIEEKNDPKSLNTPQSEDSNREKRDYDQALAVFKDANFAQAANLFADFIETYPDSKLSSNAYFWYGESFFRQKSFEKAALYYLKGYKKLPKGTKAADSLLKLSISLGEIKKEKEACATLEKLKKEFPKRPQLSLKKAAELEKKFSCKLPDMEKATKSSSK